jgi:hypothetical protein
MPLVVPSETSTMWMPPMFRLISMPPALARPAPSEGEVPGKALGRSQGGFLSKLQQRAEGSGKPIISVLTGVERREQAALEVLLDGGAMRRSGRGHPRLRPRRLVSDKAIPVRLTGAGCASGGSCLCSRPAKTSGVSPPLIARLIGSAIRLSV